MPDVEAHLTDLCNTCHSNEAIYRCPRCKARTCSLPCYKKHQQRASCNGQRDPAEYRKKSQIATPKGIDHDYNYLRSVERHLEDGDRTVWDRGIGIGDPDDNFHRRRLQAQGQFQQYLIKNRIFVKQAPKGMSRQLQNQTRVGKSRDVLWTVEWHDVDGKRITQNNCRESEPITAIYATLRRIRMNAKETAAPASDMVSSTSLKRKRALLESNSKKQHADGHFKQQAPETQTRAEIARHSPVDDAQNTETHSPSDDNDADPGARVMDDAEVQPPSSTLVEVIPETNHEAKSKHQKDNADTRPSNPSPNAIMAELDESTSSPCFYLLKPQTSSASKVLIPLKPDASLTAGLHGRSVLEYPTVYAFSPTPSRSLPAGFIAEEQYLKEQRADEAELSAAVTQAQKEPTYQRIASRTPAATAKPDPKSFLALLRRDLTH